MTTTTTSSGSDAMSGIFAQVLGETTADQKARIEEATKNANDLTGLIKKKKPKTAIASTGSAAASSTSNGKRKLDVVDEEGEGKRAKTEEPAPA
jgi:HAT1-interacting factor 1